MGQRLFLKDTAAHKPHVRARMQEYIDNGAALGWLIDRAARQVYIYVPQQKVEMLENPVTVSGDPLLAGFELDLTKIW